MSFNYGARKKALNVWLVKFLLHSFVVSFKKCRKRNKVLSGEANRAAEEGKCRGRRIAVELFGSFLVLANSHYDDRWAFLLKRQKLFRSLYCQPLAESKAIFTINCSQMNHFISENFTLNWHLTIKRFRARFELLEEFYEALTSELLKLKVMGSFRTWKLNSWLEDFPFKLKALEWYSFW